MNVFINDIKSFHSSYSSSADGWWPISFSKNVIIGSYIIKGNAGWENKLNKWIVNTSFDNKTWKTIDRISDYDAASNETPFNITSAVTCKHFGIVAKWITDNNYILHFCFFNCFGKLASSKIKYSCNHDCIKYKFFVSVYLYSLSVFETFV